MCQGKDPADARLFRAKLTCSFNDLKGLGGLRKYLRGRKRDIDLGWSSWVWRICFWVFVVLIALTWVHLRGRSAFCLTAPAGLLQNAPGKSHSVGPAPCLLNFGPFINCFDSVHAINGVDAAVMRKDSPEQQKEYERSQA